MMALFYPASGCPMNIQFLAPIFVGLNLLSSKFVSNRMCPSFKYSNYLQPSGLSYLSVHQLGELCLGVDRDAAFAVEDTQ